MLFHSLSLSHAGELKSSHAVLNHNLLSNDDVNYHSEKLGGDKIYLKKVLKCTSNNTV